MKKVCKKCGRNRRIGKFTKDSSKPDGKKLYCKDCVREMNRAYRRTPEGRRRIQKCIRAYKERNKQAIKESNRQYYIKNKDRILYNKRAREETECILISENPKKTIPRKINKGRNVCIVIDPKGKEDGRSSIL